MLFVWFFLNVIVLSLLLVIYEIITEKNQGCGTGLGPFWGKKFFEGGRYARMCEVPYFTRYHILMFSGILPAILLGEYLWFKRMPLLFAASWFSVGALEDFLWFVFNWYYPDSLRELLTGKIWWHTVYWKVGSVHIPRFYITSNLCAAALLIFQYHLSS